MMTETYCIMFKEKDNYKDLREPYNKINTFELWNVLHECVVIISIIKFIFHLSHHGSTLGGSQP